MKHRSILTTLFAVFFTLILPHQAWGALSAGDYYIYNDFFQKLLTANTSNTPRLMEYKQASDADFLFAAETSGTEGYVKLRHKSTGLYLAASTSNSYSVLLSASGSGDQYLWKVEQRFSTTIVNKKNTSKRLGSDFYSGSGSSWTYYFHQAEVPIYYDKGASTMGWYSIIPSNGEGFEASRLASKTSIFTNEQGVKEQDDYQVEGTVMVSGRDYHIIGSTPFASTGKVNLVGEQAWLVFENVRPSKVVSSYLGNVAINGAAAVNGSNCRVEIWLRGAVVIPTPSVAMIANPGTADYFELSKKNHSDLGANSNKMRTFTLKRGYMATIATDTWGGDYSRVYVADHADLTVELPTALKNRVSSVYIRNWHYTSKSGYGSTKGDVASATPACGASWFWNWDAGSGTTQDAEYVPIKQHLYWPDNGNFWKDNSTAMMLFNEPEHSEQHSSCSCNGTISSWSAYTNTSQFNSNCLRIGSPSATDLTYLKQYLDYCDNMKQRCDFTCTHGYWTSEWSSNLNTLKGYGRPIWITEWEYGASWTSGTNPSSSNDAEAKVFDILEKLEYNDYVERYAYYEFDTGGTNGWMRELFWENNYTKGLAYVGQIYARVKPHFGYNASIQHVTNWWAPSASTPVVKSAKLSDGKYTLQVENGNKDCTGSFEVQVQDASGEWSTIATVTDRSLFDSKDLSIELPAGLSAGDVVRVVATTLFNTSTELVSNEFPLTEYRTLAELQNLSFDWGVFAGKNVKTYAKDVTSASTETSQMQPVTGWIIPANGDARASAQYAPGSSLYLGASGYLAPSQNSEGSTSGGLLGFNAVWSASTQYVQRIILPRGTYTLTMPIYHSKGGTTAITKNLCGFIADNGSEYLAATKTYPVGEWTTETVTFTLDEDTPGLLSVGYQAANTGTANMPHLFMDYFQIASSDGRVWPLAGDADGDGRVTLSDLTLLISHLLTGSTAASDRCDTDRNGVINRNDILPLLEVLKTQK